jgi:hypothetical protein
MKFTDKNFELINIPIKAFYVSIKSDQSEIEKLVSELNGNVEQIDGELKFYDIDNFTLLDYMMLALRYRNIRFTKVFDINDNEILLNLKKD